MNLKLFGPHALTYNLMGKTAYRSGKIDLAIENMEKSLQLDPDRASVHEDLAHLLKEKGNIDKAIKHLQEATRIDRDNFTAHEQVAILLTTKGEIDAASHHFLETLRINPDNSAAMLNYIVFLVKVQRDDEAMVWIEEIFKKGDFQAQAHNIMGVLLANKGKQIQAVEHFKEALRINPNLKSAEANLIKAEATLE
ncbi:tetratricopeptide repeat protein [Pseudomonadota bacterium]